MDSSLDSNPPHAGGSDTGRCAQPTVWTATGHEPPVFLDHHGRRRRWVWAGGALAGAAAAFWLAALLAGAIGFATLPSLQILHRHHDRAGRQAVAFRVADRGFAQHRRIAEARVSNGTNRVPAILHRGQLPRGETS